jgi:hypothetical protein
MEKMTEMPPNQLIMPAFFYLIFELERKKLGE